MVIFVKVLFTNSGIIGMNLNRLEISNKTLKKFSDLLYPRLSKYKIGSDGLSPLITFSYAHIHAHFLHMKETYVLCTLLNTIL